jgi:hypothetical protein
MSRRLWTRPLIMIGALLPLLVVQPAVVAAAPGNPRAYTLATPFIKGVVIRWNPCAPIDYRVNLARSPKNSLPEVKKAFAAAGRATGLRFRYAGTTTAVPQARKGYNGVYPAGTEIVIAWGTHAQSRMMPKGTGIAGMGGWLGTSGYTASGRAAAIITEGRIVLNSTVARSLARGFAAKQGGTTGLLLMHEIGHAVGLDHPVINDKKQIMYPMLATKKAVWGAGDLAGLRKVGRTGGCEYLADPTGRASAAALVSHAMP